MGDRSKVQTWDPGLERRRNVFRDCKRGWTATSGSIKERSGTSRSIEGERSVANAPIQYRGRAEPSQTPAVCLSLCNGGAVGVVDIQKRGRLSVVRRRLFLGAALRSLGGMSLVAGALGFAGLGVAMGGAVCRTTSVNCHLRPASGMEPRFVRRRSWGRISPLARVAQHGSCRWLHVPDGLRLLGRWKDRRCHACGRGSPRG